MFIRISLAKIQPYVKSEQTNGRLKMVKNSCLSIFFCFFSLSIFTGIYIPETRRFFLSSHSGIWTVCRYALAPVLVANVTAARNVSLISFTNPTRIENLRHEMSKQQFVAEFLQARIENVEEITEIDNAFKQALFALWLTSNENFHAYKEKYHALSDDNDKVAIKKVQPINPTHLEAIKDIKGVTLVTVNLNNTNVPILIPPRLQAVLFNYWHEKDSVVYLLGAYARELEISAEVVTSDGTKYQFQPPIPPKKGKTSFDGYDYRPFSKFFFDSKNMFCCCFCLQFFDQMKHIHKQNTFDIHSLRNVLKIH